MSSCKSLLALSPSLLPIPPLELHTLLTPLLYISVPFGAGGARHKVISRYLVFVIADVYEGDQDEAKRIRLSGASFSPQEDPQQQLSDVTQLRSNMHNFAVPTADFFAGTTLRQGRKHTIHSFLQKAHFCCDRTLARDCCKNAPISFDISASLPVSPSFCPHM
jgi:hypothetical protein